LSGGTHLLEAWSQDHLGNTEPLRSFTVWVDSVPPVSRLLIGSPQATLADGTLLVGRATPISIQASDQGSPDLMSGVKDSIISISSGPTQVMVGSFTLASA